MRNPLFKRLPKEFIKDIAKYIVMFLFLALPIALCSGYMIGNNSMIRSYYDGIEKNKLEDGHFQSKNEIDNTVIEEIEKDNNIKIYNLYYKNELHNEDTVRIYNINHRSSINKYSYLEGNDPKNNNEIAIDRLYAENHNLKIGDKYIVSNKEYIISGFVALVDYSTMFKNNTDTMFNATSFTIALLNNEAFNELNNNNLVYNYAYLFNVKEDKNKTHENNNKLMEDIYKKLLLSGNSLDSFLAKEDNQAINFAIDDIEGDLTMMLIFGVIIVFGLAFVFALSIKSQMEREAKTIGTLKAMGYKNSELLGSYLLLPVIITLLSAIFANILGYTFMKDYIVSLYYHSYSLPQYTTYYNADAMIYTTILPVLLVLLINLIIILRFLFIPSLNLLRGILRNKKNKKVMKLSHKIKFLPRYQLRVIFQNKGTYIALFFGTFLATVILLFGLMMDPLLSHYKEEVKDNLIAPYQTILKADIDVANGEKTYFYQVEYKQDEFMIFGLDMYGSESKYFKNVAINDKNKIIINSDISHKFNLKNNDKLTVHKKYETKEIEFIIDNVYSNKGSLIIFMDKELFLNTFDEYLICYFSDNKLDIGDEYIYKTITLNDLVAVSNQLSDSMGRVFFLFTAISIILFMLLIYLLAKIVIEKNQSQISMLKIIGYKTSDINKIYNITTGIIVLISLVVSTFLSEVVIRLLWNYFVGLRMKGWLDFYVAPMLYPSILGLGLLAYLVVYLIESIKISKINLADALKEECN